MSFYTSFTTLILTTLDKPYTAICSMFVRSSFVSGVSDHSIIIYMFVSDNNYWLIIIPIILLIQFHVVRVVRTDYWHSKI